ncbi:hypothetical protein L1887_42171 [Cichorium endivia]|nr:hypothetical protein L1887_42171 [Cichorium endivia]
MVDVASEEDDLELDAAAAADSEDDFEQDGASSRRGAAKSKSARGAKSGGRKSTGGAGGSAAKATSMSGAKKAGAAAASTAANKGMSAEARMRASIDAAKDKSLKPPGASVGTKLNPQANAFRPSGAVKSGTPRHRMALPAARRPSGLPVWRYLWPELVGIHAVESHTHQAGRTKQARYADGGGVGIGHSPGSSARGRIARGRPAPQEPGYAAVPVHGRVLRSPRPR